MSDTAQSPHISQIDVPTEPRTEQIENNAASTESGDTSTVNHNAVDHASSSDCATSEVPVDESIVTSEEAAQKEDTGPTTSEVEIQKEAADDSQKESVNVVEEGKELIESSHSQSISVNEDEKQTNQLVGDTVVTTPDTTVLNDQLTETEVVKEDTDKSEHYENKGDAIESTQGTNNHQKEVESGLSVNDVEVVEAEETKSTEKAVEDNSAVLESLGISEADAGVEKEAWEVKVEKEKEQSRAEDEKTQEEIRTVKEALGLNASDEPAEEVAEEQWEKKAEKEKSLETTAPSRKYWIPNAIRKFFGAKDVAP